MKRFFNILVFCCLSLVGLAQEEEMFVIDSMRNVMARQEGREKVETMIELSRAFFDFSFDDCIKWSERAIQLSHEIGDTEFEADANYSLGIHYGYHSDLDLAQVYLKNSLDLYQQSGNEAKAFESLWNLAYFELIMGNMDTAYVAYLQVLSAAEQRHDTIAWAQANENLAFIQYQRHDFDGAIKVYESSRNLYTMLGDSLNEAHTNLNIAIILGEKGRAKESRDLFIKVIPKLESFQEKYMLLTAYKNYGMLFVRDFINYDSASYYFEKALTCVESEALSPSDRQTMDNTKADLLVEMGNLAVARHDELMAKKYFEEAYSLAEENKYHFGLMQAALSLGQLYANQGKASLSLHYLEIYLEESRRSGITIMEQATKEPLIMDYARLGRFDEMAVELEAFDEQKQALRRENSDLYDQLSTLQDEMQGLFSKYEVQNTKIQTLQVQRNHYQLAFFGLLAIILVAMAFWIFRRILLNNRNRSK